MYAKDFTETDFHYHDDFNSTVHADFVDDISQNKPAVKDNPVDFDNKTVSDYAESLVTLMPTNQYSHGYARIVLIPMFLTIIDSKV